MTKLVQRGTSIAAIALCLAFGSGCANQEEIDAIKATAEAAQAAASSAQSDARSAAAAANDAKNMAQAAQRAADAAQRAAADAKMCCDANSEKLERMFKDAMSK